MTPISTHAFAWALALPLAFAGCVAPDGAHEIDQERRSATAVLDDHGESTAGPLVQVAFPPRQSATNEDTIRIRGTARPGAGIVSITANGVPAETQDGFASWSAHVPLELGANTIEVLATIQRQTPKRVKVARLSVGRELELPYPLGFALDAAGNRLLVTDLALRSLVSVDLETGAGQVISSPERGTGPELSGAHAVALDAARNRALVTDTSLRAVVAVDLDTGNRTIITGPDTGTGPEIGLLYRIVVDAGEDRALVTDAGLAGVIAIDLDTGERTVISDANAGAGPLFIGPAGLVHDAPAGRLLVTDYELDAIFSVDLVTGDRTILADNSQCFFCMDFCTDIALDPANNRAVILDARWMHTLLAVDLDTGELTPVESVYFGPGPFVTRALALALDHAHGRMLLASPDTRSVIAVRPGLGEPSRPVATHLTRFDIGRGPRLFAGLEGLAVASGESSLVFEVEQRALLAVNHVTGNRREGIIELAPEMGVFGLELEGPDRVMIGDRADCGLVRSFDLGSGEDTVIGGGDDAGPCIDDLVDVVYDAAGRRVLALSRELGVFAIDRDTGLRTHISGEALGSGPSFGESIAIEHDPARNRVLTTDEDFGGLLSVDLQTGNRELIFDDVLLPLPPGDDHSEEPEPAHLGLIHIDSARNLAVAVDRERGAIYALDLATDTHTLVSGGYKGRGPQLSFVESLFVDPERDYIMVTDRQLNGLVAVDRVTGDRVVVSR